VYADIGDHNEVATVRFACDHLRDLECQPSMHGRSIHCIESDARKDECQCRDFQRDPLRTTHFPAGTAQPKPQKRKDTLVDQPWKIMSIGLRDWASVGHSF
jgi:hypothetical protein